MEIKSEFKKEKIKIPVMVILIAGACFLTYYFHAVVSTGMVFTHLFYIPIILSALWWKRKGIAVAIFLAAYLIFSHFLYRTGIEIINDLFRAPTFILISVITIFLTEKIVKVKDMLSEKNQYLEKLINHANAPIIIWDKEGNIIRFNTAFEELTKYQSSELIGKHFTTIFNGRTEEKVLRKIEQTLKGEYLKSVEITILDKHGNELILLWNSANVYTSDGKNIIATIAQGTDITERKRAEEALVASKTYTESIIQNFLDTLIVVDTEAKIKTLNPATCDLLGYTEEELLGQPITIVFAEEEEEEEEEVRRFFQFFRKPEKVEDLNAQDTIRNRELTYKTKDGRLIPMLFNASIVFDDMGDVTSVVAGAKDITDIKRAEAVIKKERNFSANVIATVPDSLVVVDKDLRIKSANRSFYEIFQMEPENVIGASITEILGDKDGELSTVLLNLFGTEDILDGFELQYQSKRSGLPREVRSLTSQGKMILNVIARTIIFAEEEEEEEELIVLQDITSRKQAEETLRRFNEELELKVKERTAELTKTYNELRESKQKLLKAQQVARIGFVDVNLKTNECYWSDEIYRLFGVNPDKIKPSFESTNQFTHPDDLDFVMKEIGSAIQGIKELDVDHRILRFDGKVLWVHQQAELIRDADGNPDRIIGTLHDITERKRAEEELIKAKEKAEESNRLKSAFLANISHEIRTPMNGILGFAGLLKEPNLSGEMQEEFISLIEKSGERMLNIINDIVSISKIESGIIEIHLSETNVNKQLEFVYNLMKLNAESKRLKLSFTNSLTDKEAIIKTDSDKFNGIVINLVKNAIKYTDVGEIVFGYNKKGEYLEFYVKDTGIGIPNDRQEAIFERFIQADITDKMARQGAGLGLSISKAYVDMLGGKIWVVSEVGKGSTFYFTIPYQTETEENIAIKNEVLPSIEITLGNKLKILIVEDDETSGMLLSKMIDKYSKEILIAKTGIGAIETCRNNHDIDLILMDIRMSDLDGYVATRKIREFNTKVIIIAQTACALIGDSEKAIKAGCNDYITKPIIKAELQSLIQKYFKK